MFRHVVKLFFIGFTSVTPSTHIFLAHDILEIKLFNPVCKKRSWSLVTLFGNSFTYSSMQLLTAQYVHANEYEGLDLVHYSICISIENLFKRYEDRTIICRTWNQPTSSLFVITTWGSCFDNIFVMWVNVMQLHFILCLGMGICHFPGHF